MRTALPIAALWGLAMALAGGQEPPPPPPIPGEEAPAEPPKVSPPAIPQAPEAEPATPAPAPDPADPKAEPPDSIQAVRLPVGVRPAKPVLSSTEKLMRDSETAKVEADQFWLTIDHAAGKGVTSIDVDRNGFCFLIERRVVDGELLPTVVRAGRGVPEATRKAMLEQARRKSVLYGVGRNRVVLGGGGDRMRLGVAARMGASVHGSQSLPFDQFPADVRGATNALLAAARKLPVVGSAKGIVTAVFVPPQQARRLTVLQGRRLIGVRDPGKDAKVLPPAVAAARMPGRKVVVADELEWERILGYLSGGGVEQVAPSCLIAVGSQVFRLEVEAVGTR